MSIGKCLEGVPLKKQRDWSGVDYDWEEMNLFPSEPQRRVIPAMRTPRGPVLGGHSYRPRRLDNLLRTIREMQDNPGDRVAWEANQLFERLRAEHRVPVPIDFFSEEWTENPNQGLLDLEINFGEIQTFTNRSILSLYDPPRHCSGSRDDDDLEGGTSLEDWMMRFLEGGH
jgi:hypothetical protein